MLSFRCGEVETPVQNRLISFVCGTANKHQSLRSIYLVSSQVESRSSTIALFKKCSQHTGWRENVRVSHNKVTLSDKCNVWSAAVVEARQNKGGRSVLINGQTDVEPLCTATSLLFFVGQCLFGILLFQDRIVWSLDEIFPRSLMIDGAAHVDIEMLVTQDVTGIDPSEPGFHISSHHNCQSKEVIHTLLSQHPGSPNLGYRIQPQPYEEQSSW